MRRRGRRGGRCWLRVSMGRLIRIRRLRSCEEHLGIGCCDAWTRRCTQGYGGILHEMGACGHWHTSAWLRSLDLDCGKVKIRRSGVVTYWFDLGILHMSTGSHTASVMTHRARGAATPKAPRRFRRAGGADWGFFGLAVTRRCSLHAALRHSSVRWILLQATSFI